MKLRPDSVSEAFAWTGKAGSLLQLAALVTRSRVPTSYCLSRDHWRDVRNGAQIDWPIDFVDKALAVRSSHASEDRRSQSHAGHYLTRLNVAAADAGALAEAIDAVFTSYGAVSSADEVLLQPMVAARLAAVATTHAIEDGAPYYVFSLVAGTRSDAVTRGDCAVRTVYIARDCIGPQDGDLAVLYAALREVEALCGAEPIEAEFVLEAGGVVLLQVRPLTRRAATANVRCRRQEVARELRELSGHDPELHGAQRVLALMPDWNPAELLGAHPRPMALSLFSQLIGGRAWHQARAVLGYRFLSKVDLIAPVAGRPYVDMRASANSLLPEGLPATTAAALVDAWQARLVDQPMYHDRYEFEIAQTCIDFDFLPAHRARYGGLLNVNRLDDYRARLLAITQRCLDPATLASPIAQVHRLKTRLGARSDASVAARLGLAVGDGALPFALIARLAFVHEALLRSAVTRGALAAERLAQLQAAGVSVTRDFVDAAGNSQRHKDHFGFLRAGTFEITTPSIAHLQFADSSAVTASRLPAFVASAQEKRALSTLLEESCLAITVDVLLQNYLATRHAREFAKYILSHAVSDLLDSIAADGDAEGLSREQLSWLTLAQWRERGVDESLSVDAAAARSQHALDSLLRLPPVLCVGDNLDHVNVEPGLPTFVGSGRLSAPVVVVVATTAPAELPLHSIVAIASADPGYDWIFTRAPAALITAYGGPNSHMAIRCAELRIPAVLGLGTERWYRLAAAPRVVIDADAQAVTASPGRELQ